MKKHLIIAGLILATTSFGLTASAADNAQPKSSEKVPQKEVKLPKKPPLDQVLELTEEQKAKAKIIHEQGHKQMKPIMDDLKSKKEQKKLLMQNKNAGVKEAEKLEKLNKEIVALRDKAKKIREQNNKDFEAILTAEQLKKFNEMKKEGRREFRKKHHAKMFGSDFDKAKDKHKGKNSPVPPMK